MTNQKNTGLYIHIPFCKSRCTYCDFFSGISDPELEKKYVFELCREITNLGKKYPDRIIDTLYIGGGTPSVLDVDLIATLINTVEKSFNCRFIEKTIEMNPNAHSKIRHYSEMGFDRLSIGIQSTDDVILKKIKRSHTALQGIKALETANKYFKNLSADIILGIEEEQDIKKDLDIILPMVTHLSAYILKVEEGTVLYKEIKEKTTSIASDNGGVAQYYTMYNIASERGFLPYEVSNFALFGCESKHNYKYWSMSEYFGVGASAHSYIEGRRYFNVNNLNKYLEGEHSGFDKELLERKYSIEEEKEETLMLALRTTAGLNIREFNKKFNCDFLKEYADKLNIIESAVNISSNRLYIKPDFLLVMNTIIAGLL